jgi:hypothetical protein
MEEPGGLRDLGAAGKAAWDEAVARYVRSAVRADHPYLLRAPDRHTPHVTGPDWTGLPVRVVGCLGRARALEVLDEERRLQEEYLEWRTVREPGGAIRRVELTTELRDYWHVLAAHEPTRTVDLVGELTGRAVAARDLYGMRAPGKAAPAAREQAFARTMIARPNPLNDGRDGICFMAHRSNDLAALAKLAAAAAMPCTVREPASGRVRRAIAREAIGLLGAAAVPGRASDPVIVEALGRLASERRLLAVDDPIGVYIRGVEHSRLRTPDGTAVPREWFVASRGHQRLALEVPTGEGFAVGDLVDAATERPIRHGAQIAELVQLRTLFRMSAAGVARSRAALEADPDGGGAVPCRDVRAIMADR